ncbi:MAG TPA: NADPH-dependent assimilatory sulfite reductase hemoprotein subunit [Terriglobales bacterium]|nr:NADPH-dependent assimilatory sulfite reductase hemoprotein subunit [Terriglobales bacterium]
MAETRSGAEVLKENSQHLRGTIAQELALEVPGFTKGAIGLLKFHGMYEQTDRDAKKAGLPVVPGSMVRVGIPGGVVSAEQYLILDSLADEVGDGGLRITSRQDIQFHRVRKTNLPTLVRTLNKALLSTLAACGDVVRNVTCCPAPTHNNAELQLHARTLAKRLKPSTRAYYEIWIDGEKAATAEEKETEPLYGETYLPRKFKIGITPEGDNCTDIYSNDVGLVAKYGANGLQGFVVLVGGGLGMSPGVKASHPRLADALCFVTPEEVGDVVETIVKVHRDLGNRSNRRLARLKYVVEGMGLDAFRAEVEARLGRKLEPAQDLEWASGKDHFGWHKDDKGNWFVGLPVVSGRIRDEGTSRIRSGLRHIVGTFRVNVRFTSQQNILLTDITDGQRGAIAEALRTFGIVQAVELPPVLRDSLACPALPLCGLAVTEAERVLPQISAQIQAELDAVGLDQQEVSMRITGCANGCARPYTAEIGIVGQSVDLYTIYAGGSHLGTRLGKVLFDKVKRTQIAEVLRPVLRNYRDNRLHNERFGEFCERTNFGDFPSDSVRPEQVEVEA